MLALSLVAICGCSNAVLRKPADSPLIAGNSITQHLPDPTLGWNGGGTYIFIGDISSDPQNPDYQGPSVYSNPTVNNHPHNWSMQQIANRVISGGERLAVPVIAPNSAH